MKSLKIAYTIESKAYFSTKRSLVLAEDTDYTDVAAVVLTDADTKFIHDIYNFSTSFSISIFSV